MRKYLGYDMDQIYVFGDSSNDLAMFEYATHTVAMKEHDSVLDPYTEYVTDSVMNDGIEKAMTHYQFIEKGLYHMGEQLTESDVKKIKEEIEYRKIVVRKKELEAVKEARAQGDLSENFEYKAAKQDKNRNESRIRYLERMLKTANIVSDDSKEDEIGINNTVDLYFEDDEEVETYRIVTSVRGNSLAGLISIESPLGKAVLGHKVGDRVKIPAGDDGYYVVVKRIDKTTDDSHDTLRKY